MIFSKTHILGHVGSVYYQRGHDYFKRGKVRSINVEAATETGAVVETTVSGSRNNIYQQRIMVIKEQRSFSIYGQCSCPLGGDCKHTVAGLLAWLDQAQGQVPGASRRSSADTTEPGGLSHDLNQLVNSLEQAAKEDTGNQDPESYPPEIRNRLVYWLDVGTYPIGAKYVTFEYKKISILKNGSFGAQCGNFNGSNVAYSGGPKFLRPSDREIIEKQERSNRHSYHGSNRLSGQTGAQILPMVLATGRCFWSDHRTHSTPLTIGPEIQATGHWQIDEVGAQTFQLNIPEFSQAVALPLEPAWYYDPTSHQCGPLQTDIAPTLCTTLLCAPALKARDAGAFRRALQVRLKGNNIPLPSAPTKNKHQKVKPKPRLTLKKLTFQPDPHGHWERHKPLVDVAIATLDFSYGGLIVLPGDNRQELESLKGDTLTTIPRDYNTEDKAMALLDDMGMDTLYECGPFKVPDEFEQSWYAFEDYTLSMNWLRFLFDDIPILKRKGWTVETADDFPFTLTDSADDWSLGFESSDIDWFSLSLGVQVDGEKVDLIPLLIEMFRQIPDDVDDEAFEYMMFGIDDTTFLPVGKGRFISLPAERLRPIIKTLFELFADKDTNPAKISRLRLGEVAALEDAAIQSGAIIEGCDTLRELAKKLAGGAKITNVPVPTGLNATLRPYHSDGLDWLQFLAQFDLGGVLADDMGLGKTIQALAHILVEKDNGRLDKPCLLVMPTSLIPNWRLEAERFTPSLKLLTIHGPDRKERFADIADSEVILTTYPLVHRDRETLLEHDYHIAIFDEAQAIKNPSANATKFACDVTARQKICLSGTPVENHLGELWSLFHCVTPGLLGERKTFQKNFRTPIEKQGNGEKQILLNRRVGPFMLRRTKDKVATELPPKTVTIEHVVLEGKQRDLYETVRLAMDKKVRAEIAAKGMARSHITVLDALLKLRQSCCDPRLVKLDSARKVTTSAKLERLCEMLPELIEDGRRILLFSQFTSMLALIEIELGKLDISYVKLTGQTKDRETPVRRFQAGEVPLFLISLKAGGTGLNLTTADTIIHYDPWWNPAVENQATDRAHRIGQDKPVFVYKLAARGTVEERMIEMQAKKSALAAALYDDKVDPSKRLSEQDISWLLAPLE